jgi:hypothetical protein
LKVICSLVLLMIVVVSCGGTEPGPAAVADPRSVAADPTPEGTREDPFVGSGTVMEIQAEDGKLVIAHGVIPGFMSAMSMPYAMADGVETVEVGDEITFSLEVLEQGYQIFSIEKQGGEESEEGDHEEGEEGDHEEDGDEPTT